MANILYLIAAILIIGWLIGFVTNVVGSVIHVLLVVGILVLLYQVFTGRRAV